MIDDEFSTSVSTPDEDSGDETMNDEENFDSDTDTDTESEEEEEDTGDVDEEL